MRIERVHRTGKFLSISYRPIYAFSSSRQFHLIRNLFSMQIIGNLCLNRVNSSLVHSPQCTNDKHKIAQNTIKFCVLLLLLFFQGMNAEKAKPENNREKSTANCFQYVRSSIFFYCSKCEFNFDFVYFSLFFRNNPITNLSIFVQTRNNTILHLSPCWLQKIHTPSTDTQTKKYVIVNFWIIWARDENE